jgi:hypothetical protein
MTIKSSIQVGNDGELGFAEVEVSTSGHGFIDVLIPLKGQSMKHLRIELHRKQLREFLARTCPEFSVVENYKAEP